MNYIKKGMLTVEADDQKKLENLCKMYYSIVAPRTICSNSNYHVAVGTHYAKELSVIKVGLTGPSFNQEQEVEIPPNTAKLINFKLPKLNCGVYNLTAKGISGIKFENQTNLSFESKDKSIFIQTDKATYKPGDLVRFRVLILDPNTRPAKLDEPVEITITDAANNRIKQFKNVEFTKGVYAGELQLSPFPVLGNWEIEVETGGQKEKKSIEIAKYVLPKFEVVVEAPKHALVDGKLHAIVRAKYTYGKPVKGEAVVTIKRNTYWESPDAKSIQKTAPLDGKAHVEFDLSELELDRYQYEVMISASVEEKLTGNKMSASATTQLHEDKYKIEAVDVPFTYVPNKPFKVTVVVKNYDDTPLKDKKSPLKLTLSENIHTWPRPRPIPVLLSEASKQAKVEPQPEEEPEKQIFEQQIDENSMATFEISIPEGKDENKYKHFTMTATYKEQDACIGGVSKQSIIEEVKQKAKEDLELKVITEKVQLDKDVEIKISSKYPLKYFLYQVVARGDILKSARVDVPGEANKHVLKITPTFEMIPQSDVLVYFIQNGNITFKTVNLDFGNQLQNSIKIETPDKAKPGEEIDINIRTDPDSYVGLLGVDQSVLLLNSGNDLNKYAIFNEIRGYRRRFGFGTCPISDAGLVAFSNAHSPKWQQWNNQPHTLFGGSAISTQSVQCFSLERIGPTKIPSSAFTPVEEVRKEFPETWIFESTEEQNENGQIKLHKKVPDTITSWVLTGFSVNSKTGLGLTETPTKLKVFQPFFVSTNLPYSVKRGEVINVPVAVFNYLDKNLEAEVTLDNPHNEFDFAEVTNDVDEALVEDVKRTKRVAVSADSGESVSFLIRPKKVGPITLKVTGSTPISGDAEQRVLLVEPEGITQYKNKAVFIDLTKSNENKQEIDIDVPEKIVPDSVYCEISVVGDLLGPTIKNLDSLVRMPYGCGEQNMVNFVPNILVLKYLTSVNKLTPAIEEKAKKFLEVGYQRELTYKHPDGSYSAFGTSDKSGSTWLTAYVARSFRQAAKYTQIDEKVIAKALEFLSKVQVENGSFPEVGRILDHSMVEDGKGIFLTAFTLLAFLENKETNPEFGENIKRGLEYLNKNLDDKTNLYSHALATYVLQLAAHDQKDAILEKLKARSIQDADRKYWAEKKDEPKKDKKPSWWYEPPTTDIETTSYALLAMLEAGASGDEVIPVLKWLVSKRNSLGGYYSTQATVVGLQAFTKFSEKFGSTEKGDIDINFEDDQGTKGKITINDENSLLLQTHVLPPSARHVTVTATGKGATLAQVSYRYNIEDIPDEPRFNLNAKVKDSNSAEFLKVDVCTSFIPDEKEKESNMAVVEVSLPTGYIADQDNLKALENVKNVKKIETKKGDTVVVIYFDSLDSNDICATVEGLRTHKVGKQKPASVIVYDYYNSARQARTFYAPPKSSLCDICEGDDCGNQCATRA